MTHVWWGFFGGFLLIFLRGFLKFFFPIFLGDLSSFFEGFFEAYLGGFRRVFQGFSWSFDPNFLIFFLRVIWVFLWRLLRGHFADFIPIFGENLSRFYFGFSFEGYSSFFGGLFLRSILR